jgi:hypothetical protein
LVELFAILAVLAIFVAGEVHVYRRKREMLTSADLEFPYWCLVVAPVAIFAGVMAMSRLFRSEWNAQLVLGIVSIVLFLACSALRALLVKSAREY